LAIQERRVKNKRDASGELTGKPGTVYDVNIKYKSGGTAKTYSRRGFPNRKEAMRHEAEMKAKLTNSAYTPPSAAQRKQTVQDYMTEWLERHGTANLRPSTRSSYQSFMKNHIFPHIGGVPLGQLSPAMLDDLYRQLSEEGLSPSSVRYAHRILGVSLEHARKYHYIETNPARDTITRFGKQGKTPEPYTVEQMRMLLNHVRGTWWEPVILLGGLYGLRMSEILGLRWRNVDLENGRFRVIEQLPYQMPPGTTELTEMAPVKSGLRTLPITDSIHPYFQNQLAIQAEHRRQASATGEPYYENDLVIPKPNGAPRRRECVSSDFGDLLRRLNMPHIRFHDLRHSAATNMHQLTGDFFTVSQILGHSLKGAGIQLGISSSLDTVTAYILPLLFILSFLTPGSIWASRRIKIRKIRRFIGIIFMVLHMHFGGKQKRKTLEPLRL
jgi:integrase